MIFAVKSVSVGSLVPFYLAEINLRVCHPERTPAPFSLPSRWIGSWLCGPPSKTFFTSPPHSNIDFRANKKLFNRLHSGTTIPYQVAANC